MWDDQIWPVRILYPKNKYVLAIKFPLVTEDPDMNVVARYVLKTIRIAREIKGWKHLRIRGFYTVVEFRKKYCTARTIEDKYYMDHLTFCSFSTMKNRCNSPNRNRFKKLNVK